MCCCGFCYGVLGRNILKKYLQKDWWMKWMLLCFQLFVLFFIFFRDISFSNYIAACILVSKILVCLELNRNLANHKVTWQSQYVTCSPKNGTSATGAGHVSVQEAWGGRSRLCWLWTPCWRPLLRIQINQQSHISSWTQRQETLYFTAETKNSGGGWVEKEMLYYIAA